MLRDQSPDNASEHSQFSSAGAPPLLTADLLAITAGDNAPVVTIGQSAPTAVIGDNQTPADTVQINGGAAATNSTTTFSGTVTVTATASDNVGVAGVQFLLDGALLGAEDTTTPYSVSWDTTTATNASHTLLARARDAAGNFTNSAPLTVTVSNTTAPAMRPRR